MIVLDVLPVELGLLNTQKHVTLLFWSPVVKFPMATPKVQQHFVPLRVSAVVASVSGEV